MQQRLGPAGDLAVTLEPAAQPPAEARAALADTLVEESVRERTSDRHQLEEIEARATREPVE